MKKVIYGFFMAWGNFSILPCPVKIWKEEYKKYMLMTMQIVGFLIGLIQVLAYFGLDELSKLGVISGNGFIVAAIVFVIPFMLTGFIHLDGFMDCCDAILSRRDQEERRRILKDSTVGAFSVICLCILLIISYIGIFSVTMSTNVIFDLIIFATVMMLVRAFASFDVLRLKPINTSQYSNSFDNSKKDKIKSYTILIAVVCVIILNILGYFIGINNIRTAIILVIAVAAQALSRKIAVKNIGGMNGDIAGFSIVIGELAGLVTLALLI